MVVPVARVPLPRHDEGVTVAVQGNGGEATTVVHQFVFWPQFVAVGVELLSVNCASAVAIIAPHDVAIAPGIRSDSWGCLAGCATIAVDPQVHPQPDATGAELLGPDVIVAIAVVVPHHIDVADGIHTYGRRVLLSRVGTYWLIISPTGDAVGPQALSVDVPVPVITTVLPHYHNVTCTGIQGRGRVLVAGRVIAVVHTLVRRPQLVAVRVELLGVDASEGITPVLPYYESVATSI